MVEGGEGVEDCFRNYLGTEIVRLFWGGKNEFLISISSMPISTDALLMLFLILMIDMIYATVMF